jgi:hypothetical protein
VINAIFDSTITKDPNAATIERTINTAIQNFENTFSIPITVTIKFQEGSSGLGSSSTYIIDESYASLRASLAAAATTPAAKTAVASLPTSIDNPVNGNADVYLTLPDARILGYSGANPPPGMPDGTITLNTSICNLSRSSINPTKYDLLAVTSHEIDEVLGFGSALNGLANGAPAPTGPVSVDDLWRYDQNGVRSFNTTLTNQAYFSIDGGHTDLARFNQQAGDDFSDWYSPGGQTPQVQDAVGTPGATPNLGVELIRLNVDGYTPAPLAAPTGLTATPVSTSQINLSWNSEPGATSYTLEWSTDDQNWNPLASTTATSYSDTGLRAGTTYYFRVSASNALVSSAYSAPASATTQVPPQTIGVFDPSTATWALRNENSAGYPDAGVFQYGWAGLIPVVGDWNGSGHTGIGLFDPQTATWYLREEDSAGNPDVGVFQYGYAGVIPVVGDWNGSGHTGIGLFDPHTATWILRNEAGLGSPDAGVFQYGYAGVIPVVGDWKGSATMSVSPATIGSGTVQTAAPSRPNPVYPAAQLGTPQGASVPLQPVDAVFANTLSNSHTRTKTGLDTLFAPPSAGHSAPSASPFSPLVLGPFGDKASWLENILPSADHVSESIESLDRLFTTGALAG